MTSARSSRLEGATKCARLTAEFDELQQKHLQPSKKEFRQDQMHERGLLEKTNNAEDGRSSLLSLSEKGRAIYFDLVPKMLAAEARMFDGVSEEEISAFVAIMAKVRKNLQKA